MRLPQQLHHGWYAVVEPHGILGQLGVLVARGQVTQGADGGLRHILLLPRAEHGVDQRLYSSVLGHQCLEEEEEEEEEEEVEEEQQV